MISVDGSGPHDPHPMASSALCGGHWFTHDQSELINRFWNFFLAIFFQFLIRMNFKLQRSKSNSWNLSSTRSIYILQLSIGSRNTIMRRRRLFGTLSLTGGPPHESLGPTGQWHAWSWVGLFLSYREGHVLYGKWTSGWWRGGYAMMTRMGQGPLDLDPMAMSAPLEAASAATAASFIHCEEN
jgi:hypothetical protein